MSKKTEIDCPSCKQSISVAADVCPNCGVKTGKAKYKEKLEKKIASDNKCGIIFFVVFIVCVIVLVVKGNAIGSKGLMETVVDSFSGDLQEDVALMKIASAGFIISGALTIWCFGGLVINKSTLKNLEKRPEQYRHKMK